MSKNAARFVSRKATRQMVDDKPFSRRDIEKYKTLQRKYARLMKEFAQIDNA